MNLDPFLTPLRKWIKGLNTRPKTIKFQEENTGRKSLKIGLGNDFLGMTPKHNNKNKNNLKCEKIF